MSEYFKKIVDLQTQVEKVVQGQTKPIRWIMAAYLSGGHVLLEDRPGTGKTTLAKTLASSLNVDFHRVQFTPDLLPSDILGVSIYNPKEKEFCFHKGPIFTDIFLADEINRSSPRTQSALLEAMAEKQVTTEGEKRPLEDNFFVIATQNSIESQGTYPLPEAQMDRFSLSFSLNELSLEQEVKMLKDREHIDPFDQLLSIFGTDDLNRIKQEVKDVKFGEIMQNYLVKLIHCTRHHSSIQIGASPRATLSILKLTQAIAWMNSRDYVIADDLLEIFIPAIAHRVIFDRDLDYSGQQKYHVLEDILQSVSVPA